MLRLGDRVVHRNNDELGVGLIVAVDSHQLVVDFADAGEVLRFAPPADALAPLRFAAGERAWLEPDGEDVVIATLDDSGRCRLADGRVVALEHLWPTSTREGPVDLLARGVVQQLADLTNRLDALRLEHLREAGGLGSFLGGRIRLYPHQLFAAESACRHEPVRWLLADGVGLGKTVEACLVMNRLIHTGQASRVLVVAPESLTVQWLGELWRKHHQVFTLLDEARINGVARDQGEDFNPFEVHRRAIIALETLCDDPRLPGMAAAVGIDLLVVDEAHHLQRPEGHPGNLAYRAIAPIAALDRNLLLLTATPLEDDALGFLRLVQLLRPDQLPEDEPLLERLERRQPLPPCTSATRAQDIGGWPPRVPAPVDLEHASWQPLARLEHKLRSLAADNEVQRARKATLIHRGLASPAALRSHERHLDPEARALLEQAQRADPRLQWLVDNAPSWRAQRDKTLVFVAHRESLDAIKETLERRAHLRVGIFHEELSTKRRDIEAAQLRLADGPSLMVSTECGGEGRNFEMCDRLVLFDLPWHPGVVEQRIGRLDRIGRDRPTEVVYFRPPSGLGLAVVRLYEEIGLFRQSLGGLDRELRHIAREVARVAVDGPDDIHPGLFGEVLERARAARTRVQKAAYHELHCNTYQESTAAAILARVPVELEELTAAVVLRAAASLGFDVEEQSGRATWFIALGTESLVDRLPGVPAGARFLGTFSREEAVTLETLDFFTSGHPLVEGLLEELREGERGRTACFEITGEREGFALLAVYRRDTGLEAVVVDEHGELQPHLAEHVLSERCQPRKVRHRQWTALNGWSEAIHRLARALPPGAMAFARTLLSE